MHVQLYRGTCCVAIIRFFNRANDHCRSSHVHCLSRFCRQSLNGIGLTDEVNATVEYAIVHNDVLRISRHE